MSWQPIETAPKDYATILVSPNKFDTQFAFVTWWISREQRWANNYYENLYYWMPLPKLPEVL